MTILFFGSFQEYSAVVLSSLLTDPSITVVGVVTTPPHPSGRDKILTPNPVQVVAETHNVPVFTPVALTPDVLSTLPEPDYILTTGYGKLIPEEWLKFPKIMALNLHLSYLPDFRGANPAEWGILLGAEKTGVTLIEMSPQFDTGSILAQAEEPFLENDTRESVYKRLYELGAQQLPNWLKQLSTLPAIPQKESVFPYASRFLRDDGFVSWDLVKALMNGESISLDLVESETEGSGMGSKLQAAWNWCEGHQELCNSKSMAVFVARASRALSGFPSLWTLAPTPKGPKRLKIHAASTTKSQSKDILVLETVQLEGQQSGNWTQIKSAIS